MLGSFCTEKGFEGGLGSDLKSLHGAFIAHVDRGTPQKPKTCLTVRCSCASFRNLWHTDSTQIPTAVPYRWLICFPSGGVSKLAKNKCHAAMTYSISKGSVFPVYFCLFNEFLIKFCFLASELMWWHSMKLFRIKIFLDFSLLQSNTWQ